MHTFTNDGLEIVHHTTENYDYNKNSLVIDLNNLEIIKSQDNFTINLIGNYLVVDNGHLQRIINLTTRLAIDTFDMSKEIEIEKEFEIIKGI